jgi:aminomethyltransferase
VENLPRLKRTPLYAKHLELGAKMVEFGGWEMPVQYAGILEEHQAVRHTAGLFDVCHMGEIQVLGAGAAAFLQRVLTNDVVKMAAGQVIYTLMCYPDGGIVDDMLVYKLDDEKYMLVVNAGNTDKDWNWLREYAHVHAYKEQAEDFILQNISAEVGLLALQGPRAEEILVGIGSVSLKDLRYYRFAVTELAGIKVIISRTGYTGEDGFEIYVGAGNVPAIWDLVMEAGKAQGLVPAGLGARDTLRFEAGLPLYGHELTEKTTPLEAGLEYFVAWEKGDFVGKEALLAQKKEGVPRKLVGLTMLERGIPRAGYPIEKGGARIGEVTSGSYAPSLEQNLGLAYVLSDEAWLDNEVEVMIRGKALKAKICKKPFYRRTR